MHFAKEPEEDEFEEMIAEGLSQLGRSADGTLQVYLNLFLPVSVLFAIIHNICTFKITILSLLILLFLFFLVLFFLTDDFLGMWTDRYYVPTRIRSLTNSSSFTQFSYRYLKYRHILNFAFSFCELYML